MEPTTSNALELASQLEQMSTGATSLADALRIAPEHIDLLVDKALAQAHAGRLAASAALFTQLTATDTRSAILPYLLASTLAEAQLPADAESACREALRRDGGGEETAPFRGEVFLLLGRTLSDQGAKDDARVALETACALSHATRPQARALLQRLGDGA